MASDVEVIEHDPARRHTVRTRVLGVEARFAFEISGREEGSTVRMTGEVTGSGLSRLLEKPLGRMMEKADDRALERLGEACLREGRR